VAEAGRWRGHDLIGTVYEEGQMSLRRREFIAGLGGTVAWPLAARAQQGDRVRRIGMLMPVDENDPPAKTFVSAFTQALAGLGWTDGRNVRVNLRWTRYGPPCCARTVEI
jgi:putative ABC transport system substrate-binding protein